MTPGLGLFQDFITITDAVGDVVSLERDRALDYARRIIDEYEPRDAVVIDVEKLAERVTLRRLEQFADDVDLALVGHNNRLRELEGWRRRVISPVM